MVDKTLYPRFAERPFTEALEDSPVVLIHGPRQCGKTTLVQMVCEPGHLRWRASSLRSRSTKPGASAIRSKPL